MYICYQYDKNKAANTNAHAMEYMRYQMYEDCWAPLDIGCTATSLQLISIMISDNDNNDIVDVAIELICGCYVTNVNDDIQRGHSRKKGTYKLKLE